MPEAPSRHLVGSNNKWCLENLVTLFVASGKVAIRGCDARLHIALGSRFKPINFIISSKYT
jgi:hypothetical protein